jgi:hypothetical protein
MLLLGLLPVDRAVGQQSAGSLQFAPVSGGRSSIAFTEDMLS